jgi:hypothetical protein
MSERRQVQDTAGKRTMPNSTPLTRREFDRLPEHIGPLAVIQRKFAVSQISRLSSDDVLILQRTLGNRAVRRLFLSRIDPRSPSLPVQARLTIGPADDPYEREADHIAAQVVSLINAPKQTASDLGDRPQHLQRLEDDEDLKRTPLDKSIHQPGPPQRGGELERKPLMRFAATELDGMEVNPNVESSIQAARGSGRPLTENLRASMENAFGADFSRVRAHTGAEADELNRSIQARAFTTGQDIFFREGEYNPASKEGQFLIAHELSHVMQQNQVAKKNGANVINQFAVRRPPTHLQRLITIGGKEEDKVPDNILRLIRLWEERGIYAKGTANILQGLAEESVNKSPAYKSWLDAADEVDDMIVRLSGGNLLVSPGASRTGAHSTMSTSHTTSSPQAQVPMDISSETGAHSTMSTSHTTSSQQARVPMDISPETGAHSTMSTSHTTSSQQAQDTMDISSESGPVSSPNLGTAKAIHSLEFGSVLQQDEKALASVKLVMSNLGPEAKAFFQFVEKDPLTSIEFETGKVQKASGETFLYAHIGDWVNLEDPTVPVFINWHKLKPNTRLKVMMVLGPGPHLQVCLRAVHELTVHGVFYRKFIEFIRSTTNRFSEVALYFFRQTYERGELNAYSQHFMHGQSPEREVSGLRQRGAPTYLNPASGIQAYNETILNLVGALWTSNPKLAKQVQTEAQNEVVRHGSQFGTEKATGKTSHQKQDAEFFKKVSPRKGSFSELFTLLVRRKLGGANAGPDLLLDSLTAGWVNVLLAYFDYKASINEAFPIERSLVENLPAPGDGSAILTWSQEPLAETQLEAIAEYLVYGWQFDNTTLSDQSNFVINLLLDVSSDEWAVVNKYITFRILYYVATGKNGNAEHWQLTLKVIPWRIKALNKLRRIKALNKLRGST